MPAYVVSLSAAVTTSVEVEADTPHLAESAALAQVHVSLCHQCAGEMNPPDEWQVEDVELIPAGST